MNIGVAIAIFIGYACAEWLYVSFVRNVNTGRAVKTANCAAAIVLVVTVGVGGYVENKWYLLPALAGSWVGAYFAVQGFDLSTCSSLTRRFVMRFLLLIMPAILLVMTIDEADAGRWRSGGCQGTYGAMRERERVVFDGDGYLFDGRANRVARRQAAKAYGSAGRYGGYGSYGQTAYGSDGSYGGVTAPTPKAAPPAEAVVPHSHGAVTVTVPLHACRDGNCSRRFLLGGNRRNSRFQ